MILAKLRGGLSNQMFQYAAARRLAHRHGTELRLDIGWYAKTPVGATPRAFELDHLNITATLAMPDDVIGTDGVRHAPWRDLPVALWRKLRPRFRFVAERHLHFDQAVLDLPDNVCLFGYWPSVKYFQDIETIIRHEFAFKDPPSAENAKLIEEMQGVASVSLHVRRGDYALDPHINRIHGTCTPTYYEAAMAHVAAQVERPHFFVFSDDLAWAKEHIRLRHPTRHVEHNRGSKSYEDLRLMSHCRHHIIANSGFSWWGAWLNPRTDKIVCAPERWFADAPYDTKDIVPGGWVKL